MARRETPEPIHIVGTDALIEEMWQRDDLYAALKEFKRRSAARVGQGQDSLENFEETKSPWATKEELISSLTRLSIEVIAMLHSEGIVGVDEARAAIVRKSKGLDELQALAGDC